MNTNTGHISGFTGAGTSGTMSDMIIVCPEETSVTPGGGTIYPGPFPGGITIPIPGDGQYFLRIISVDDDGNAARLDYVVKKETASQVSEPALCIKDYLNPEPWNDWFGIDNPDLPVVFLASDPESEITQVDFLYSLDGLEWMWYFTDNDGTQPLSNTFGTAVDEGNGWSSLFPIELLPIEDMDVYFKAVATLENGDAVEVEASSFFNISPPSLIEMNVEDWMSFEEDYILLEVLPGLCTDLSYIEVELVPKADTFQKGIPPMYQRTHSDFHCTPTAAAACLKYYANQGDGTITGGLTDDELIEALAELFWTWFYEGTYPSDLANGLRQWINTHGGNYVVTRPLPFNWRHMRNELERCQDVITNIYWPGGGGHSMTFNSIVNRPVGGKIKVDFMDPWTGQIEYGWIDPNTGQITGFTGAGTSGELDNIVYVCPKEPSITPGTGTIIPGPTPMPMPIPVPNPGLYFLRIKAVDNSNNVARFDLVVERKSPQLNYIDPGEDQWTVPWGRFNFGVGEELPPLPADFFFPGSEPFEGQVDFIGLNSEGSQLPEADVIINRLDPAEFPEPLPSTQSVPTEIVALELRSTEPILVQGQFPVDSFFDVFTELSVEAPQQGTCNITLEDALGGIFEKQTSFHLTFTFVKTDDPTHIIEWDSWEQGIPELSFYSESPYGFNLPPKPNQFDPVGEDYFILRTELGSSLFLLPLYQREDAFFVEVNEAGVPILWEGTGFNGNAWYYYEFTDWWNAWFFDHPLDNERRKIVDLNIDLLPANPEFPSNATIVYNWSTNQWPGWPEIARPPLPADLLTPEMEGLMITRSEPVFDGFLEVANDLSISDHFEFLDFNPEWFSMDIRGSNYILSGTIKHVCFKEGERPVGVGDLFLGINHYVNPSPWQNWFGGIDDTTHVELFAEDTANLISYVEFYHSQDGMNWTLFGTDYDGNSVILGYDTLVQGELDGWSAYLSHVSLPLTDMTVYFAAKAFLTNGETLLAENSADYDVSPPDAIEPGVDDWMQTPLDHFMLNINPGLCFDLDHAIVKIEAIADSFAKGIPPISQHLLSGTHCAPTSAAACFKYFESKGDTNICGGRNDSSLVYILGKKAYTSKKGTKAANLIKTLREWQKDHGNNYNVSLSKKFNWKKMRDELMRCQDVLVTIDWPNSKMNHMMTFNSIVQRPKGGKIRVDFMDPWTGAIEYADLDPESGNVTNLTGNEQPRSGKLINVIYICPKEPNPNGGGGGNQVPGPNPDPLLIPLPNPGLYKLSIVAVDEMEHSARFDFIIERTALDWGDAPDPTYPTLAASNGPSHGIDYITYLGDTIDGELNGLPDAFALGDDLNNVDDEDGVKFLNSLVVGKDAIINVKPSSDNAYLNVWIDLDRNGNFSAANEHVVVELMPAAGSLDIVIPIPASASTGETFARFRYSTQPNLSYEGPAENGEVEDYKVFIHEPTNHKMHFPQFPKLNGWDVNFTVPYVLADDWMCSESGEIGNMQFWISLLGDMGAFELDYCIDKIYLSIHTDIPASESPSGFSMPADPPLWERTIVEGDYTWDHYFEFPQGWYSPYEGVVQPNDHYHCFRINIDNIEDPFVQQEGTIYWLRISMLSKYPDQFFFGWKSAIEQWNDNAVYNYPFPGYPPDDWMELYHPYNDDEPMDLSFVISPAVNCPTADAGPDATICPDSYYMLYGSATNYLSVTWGTSGDGTFDDPTLLNPAYAPGTMDLANGSVILCLSAAPIPPCTQPAISCMTLTFAELQSYTLFKGYRGFSSYLVPLDPDIENMFDPLVSNGLLGILYSYSGFYWPDQYINSLTWDEYSGYVLKTNGDTEFSICGEEVMNKNIVLNATSWNLIPVLSRNGVDVVSLFQTLNGFFVVKEVAKWNVYWPMFNINTIGTVVPGSAYEVYTTNGGTITYPTSSDNVTYEKPAEFVNNTPWNDVIYSLNSHVVGFDPDALGVLENGDIVGAFTSAGLCAGMVEYSGDGVCLVIAGDDPYTQHVDGFEEDEYLTFKLYRSSTSVVYDMDVVYEPSLDNSGQFHSSGISAITQLKLDAAGVDDRDTDDLRIYPNPTKGIFTIEGFESEAELSIFTSFGKEVYQKVINQAERIDLRTLPNGVYLVKVTDAKKTYYDKLILKK